MPHAKPKQGSRSPGETVGAAPDVDFSAPAATEAGETGARGHPAAPERDLRRPVIRA
ncbi:hypothetical protein ABTY20_12765 [Streptomyces sp. NPDC126497]|uniref:hypothetical protein n=1 Tax=Streptomyces sp. NPDC126497 TaxID=3155313 RepID=UPI003328658F